MDPIGVIPLFAIPIEAIGYHGENSLQWEMGFQNDPLSGILDAYGTPKTEFFSYALFFMFLMFLNYQLQHLCYDSLSVRNFRRFYLKLN